LRSFGLVAATVVFWGFVLPVFTKIVMDEKKLTDLSAWRKAYRYTFGEVGALRKQLGNYIDYFRPNYHPWDHDNRAQMLALQDLIYELADKTKAAKVLS
jgi:predicted metal-dependent hydrolase